MSIIKTLVNKIFKEKLSKKRERIMMFFFNKKRKKGYFINKRRFFIYETRDLYMRVLLIYCTCEGSDGSLVMESHSNLGALYLRRGVMPGMSLRSELLLSTSHYSESLRISILVNGIDHAFSRECLKKIDEVAQYL